MMTHTAYALLAADLIRSAAMGRQHAPGSGKVWLSTIPGIDMADTECRLQLDEMRKYGLIQLCRCDLPTAFEDGVELSAASALSVRPAGGTYTVVDHLLVLPR